MKNLLNFFFLFLANVTYTNYFFLRFEQSDFSIAIQGLNNFSEDLNDLGLTSDLKLNYLFFAITVGFLITFFTYLLIDNFSKTKDPLEVLKYILKIGSINFSVLVIVLYLFRFFNFPRVDILLNIIFYPLIFSALIYLIGKNTNTNVKNKKISYFLLLLFLLIAFIFFNQVKSDSISTDIVVENLSSIENEVEILIPLDNQENVNCFKWDGSLNYRGCLSAIELKKVKSYSKNQVNNFVLQGSDLFTVLKSGIVLKNGNVFVDIRDRVSSEVASETGLYDIAFHPFENYFLLSYSNKFNELEIEKYVFSEDEIISNNTVLIIPNSTYSHFCGSLIWSNYFDSFLYCVGDLGIETLSLSTNVNNGKILLLDAKQSINSPLISDSNNQIKLDNIVAYGLRNPWNFLEYENMLIVPDVGNKSTEELNILELNSDKSIKNSFLLGWPIFEGKILSEDKFYGLKLWEDSESQLYDYVIENAIDPIVFYNRPAPENNRAAILGTLIFENQNSKFHKHIIFSDFLSKEIFAYDYQNDELFIINIPYFPGYMTAIGNHPVDPTKILLATTNSGTSEVYELQLP